MTGVRKCGTTTLFDFLKNTGHFRACRIKEPQFFCLPEPTVERHLDWYADQFPSGDQPLLDGSTLYAQTPGFRERIGRHFDEARYLLCLRDPARRMFSAYWHQRAKPGGVEKRNFDEVLSELEKNLGMELYGAEQVALETALNSGKIEGYDPSADYHKRNFGASFSSGSLDGFAFFRYAGESMYSRHWPIWAPGQADLRLVFFEQLLRQPEEILAEVLRFAGLPETLPLRLPPNRNKTYDAGRQAWLGRLAKSGWLDRVRRHLPDRLKTALKENLLPETEKMTRTQYDRARRLLQSEYAFWSERYPFLETLWR